MKTRPISKNYLLQGREHIGIGPKMILFYDLRVNIEIDRAVIVHDYVGLRKFLRRYIF